jgi:hypothetical protein
MMTTHLEQLQMFAGPGVQLLLRSQEATERHLDDLDPIMRWSAVIIMTYHWGPTEQFKTKCEEMALHDPDPIVRSKAIGSLGTCFAGTTNPRIENLLANVVCNESECYGARRSAYMSLFVVNQRKPMPPAELLLNLRIPEDVDWEYVHSMLTAG